MYQFITGPLLWLSFVIFFAGLILNIVFYIKGLDWRLDRVTYSINTSCGIRGAVRSVLFWILPFGVRSWRLNPIFTIFVFIFHTGLIFTPIFLNAHNIILKERWGISLWTISDSAADLWTIAVIISVSFIILRRIALTEVRIMTTVYDYILLAITVAPFITGFIAYHNPNNYYHGWIIAHIISGEIMLISIPFTRLSHMVLFFLTRAQLGMDFGIKRGGMKNKGLAW